MKHAVLLAFAVLASACTTPLAHPETVSLESAPDVQAQRAAMVRLVALAGHWRGEAQERTSERRTLYPTLRVERDMDGLLLMVRANIYDDIDRSDSPISDALSIISFDETRHIYEVRTYSDGRAALSNAVLLEDGALQWVVHAPSFDTRITIAIEQSQWHESRDISRDGGASWRRCLEMHLTAIAHNAP